MTQQQSSTSSPIQTPARPAPLSAADLAKVSGAGPNGGWAAAGPNGGWL